MGDWFFLRGWRREGWDRCKDCIKGTINYKSDADADAPRTMQTRVITLSTAKGGVRSPLPAAYTFTSP